MMQIKVAFERAAAFGAILCFAASFEAPAQAIYGPHRFYGDEKVLLRFHEKESSGLEHLVRDRGAYGPYVLPGSKLRLISIGYNSTPAAFRGELVINCGPRCATFRLKAGEEIEFTTTGVLAGHVVGEGTANAVLTPPPNQSIRYWEVLANRPYENIEVRAGTRLLAGGSGEIQWTNQSKPKIQPIIEVSCRKDGCPSSSLGYGSGLLVTKDDTITVGVLADEGNNSRLGLFVIAPPRGTSGSRNPPDKQL